MANFALPKLPQLPVRPAGQSLGWVPNQADQQEALESSGQNLGDTYDILLQVATIITSTVESVYHLPIKSIAYGAQAGVDGAKLNEAGGAEALRRLAGKANPLFARHGVQPGTANVATQTYLANRRWKKIGGSAVQTLGDLSSLIPATFHANVPGAAYHGHAAALTMFHLAKVGQVALQHSEDRDLQDWCKLIASVKALKLAIRGGQFTGTIVPLASLPSSIAAAVVKTGVKLTIVGACYAAAAKIHWRAYAEQNDIEMRSSADEEAAGTPAAPVVPNFSRPFGRPPQAAQAQPNVPNFSRPFGPAQQAASPPGAVPNFSRPPPAPAPEPAAAPAAPAPSGGPGAGPASAIFWEIFAKRGVTAMFGKYDVSALVNEPAGWLALGDKLMLI